MTSLQGRNIVVTGAGSGIGKALARRLVREGARVGLLGRTRAKVEHLQNSLGDATHAVEVDVRDREAVDRAFYAVAKKFGHLHAVIANAGVAGANSPQAPVDRWDEIVRTNLDGTYFTLRAFEKVMDRAAPVRHAVAISSCLARFGVAGGTAYCASKAGVLGLVRAFAAEWAPQTILVNAICPGWVETPMMERRMQEIAEETRKSPSDTMQEMLGQTLLGRMTEPDEIADLVVFLLSAGGRSFTGQSFDPNNGVWMG